MRIALTFELNEDVASAKLAKQIAQACADFHILVAGERVIAKCPPTTRIYEIQHDEKVRRIR